MIRLKIALYCALLSYFNLDCGYNPQQTTTAVPATTMDNRPSVSDSHAAALSPRPPSPPPPSDRKDDSSTCRYENFKTSNKDLTSGNFLWAIHQFSVNFFQTLSKNQESNFVTSPISALIVLVMLAYGAGDEIELEVTKTLSLPMETESILLNFHDFIADLNNNRGVELHLANKLYIQNDYPIISCFKELTIKAFQSEIESINFQNSDDSANKINTWCRNKTNGKITDIINADDLRNTVLMMINAVYFKGNWNVSFSSQLKYTHFFLSAKTPVVIQMMCKSGFRYGSLLYEQIEYIELPYEGTDPANRMSMYIILPQHKNTLNKTINSLLRIDFENLVVKDYYNDFCMPKFIIKTNLHIIPTLESMGIHEMFKDTADFSNLTTAGGLKITQAIQKAFISVDEKGSEAAAVTVESGVPLSLVDPIFYVNKPFIAVIISKNSGTPLFWARVNDPRLPA